MRNMDQVAPIICFLMSFLCQDWEQRVFRFVKFTPCEPSRGTEHGHSHPWARSPLPCASRHQQRCE